MVLQQVTTTNRFEIGVVRDEPMLKELQSMRYKIFAEEMGADIRNEEYLDCDPVDAHCFHLYVRDTKANQLAACTRLLTRDTAKKAHGFYSQGEFIMDSVLALEGELLEVGRTCVHPHYRDGSGIALLWQGLSQMIQRTHARYLFGCASVPYTGNKIHISALMQRLEKYALPEEMKIVSTYPFTPVEPPANVDTPVPPLLKAYLRLGARIAATPCIDEQFSCVDFLVLLDTANLNQRYARHFKIG